MRGAVLKFTFHSQNTVILQEAPATWAEQFALSPPCRLARWDAGQSALLKAQTTFGNYCSVLAASTRADDSLSLQSQCRPTVQSLELTSQVPLPYWLHISRTCLLWAIHLRPSDRISISALLSQRQQQGLYHRHQSSTLQCGKEGLCCLLCTTAQEHLVILGKGYIIQL